MRYDRFMPRITRRGFVAALPLACDIACSNVRPGDNRLTARPNSGPSSDPGSAVRTGGRPLKLRQGRDGLLYVPASSSKYEKAPLVVSLHGVSQNADLAMFLWRSLADEQGFLVLAPASKKRTWDALEGSFEPDVDFNDRCLMKTFGVRAIDPARMAISGFSDGASYALSLGLANGDLFTAVLGFSPGVVVPGQRTGKPPVFISHGTRDQILPINECSRRIVPELQSEGYQVTYREFDGPHTAPPEIISEATQWFLNPA